MPPRKRVTAAPSASSTATSTRSSRSKTKAAESLAAARDAKTTADADGEVAVPPSKKASTRKAPTRQAATKAKATPKVAATKKGKEEQVEKPVPKTKKTAAKAKAKPPTPPKSNVQAARTPPTDTSAEPEEKITIPKKASTSKPKKGAAASATTPEETTSPNMRKRARDAAEDEDAPKASDVKNKKGRTSPTKKAKTQKNSPYNESMCAAWFAKYADSDEPDMMTPEGSNRWLQDLGISEESAAYFVIAWRFGAKAMFSLSKDEFMTGMKKLGVDTNEKLLDKLPELLYQAIPNYDSSDFRSFYKFCFEYGKSGGPPGAKNVDIDVATEFLSMVLDRDRYSVDYRPTSELKDSKGRKGDGEFTHVHAFIEFLKTARPVKVINKDQWDSFLQFNKSVAWNLDGYSEDGAWPSLFDQYVDWRRLMYPDTIQTSSVDVNNEP